MHIERSESRLEAEKRAYFVVHAGEIRSVCDVKSFRCQPKVCFLTQFVSPAQTQVEGYVVRTQPGVARGADRTLVGGVIVAVHFTTSQQVERVSPVVGENGSELEPRQDIPVPGTVDDSGDHHFVPLIKLGKTPVYVNVRRILRTVVGVVVSGCIKALAEGVIAKQCEALAEAPLEFNDTALVNRIGLRAVLVVLYNERIHKALYGRAR